MPLCFRAIRGSVMWRVPQCWNFQPRSVLGPWPSQCLCGGGGRPGGGVCVLLKESLWPYLLLEGHLWSQDAVPCRKTSFFWFEKDWFVWGAASGTCLLKVPGHMPCLSHMWLLLVSWGLPFVASSMDLLLAGTPGEAGGLSHSSAAGPWPRCSAVVSVAPRGPHLPPAAAPGVTLWYVCGCVVLASLDADRPCS